MTKTFSIVPSSQARNADGLDHRCSQLGKEDDEEDHKVERAVRPVSKNNSFILKLN